MARRSPGHWEQTPHPASPAHSSGQRLLLLSGLGLRCLGQPQSPRPALRPAPHPRQPQRKCCSHRGSVEFLHTQAGSRGPCFRPAGGSPAWQSRAHAPCPAGLRATRVCPPPSLRAPGSSADAAAWAAPPPPQHPASAPPDSAPGLPMLAAAPTRYPGTRPGSSAAGGASGLWPCCPAPAPAPPEASAPRGLVGRTSEFLVRSVRLRPRDVAHVSLTLSP